MDITSWTLGSIAVVFVILPVVSLLIGVMIGTHAKDSV